MSGFDLQEKLIQAKAVMDKVDGNPSIMKNAQRSVMESNMTNAGQNNYGENPNLPPVSNNFNSASIDSAIQSNTTLTRPKITEDRVNSSNLPDAIKQLMIDHPIPEVSFGNTIPNSLIEGAAEKMRKLSGLGNTESPNVGGQTQHKKTKTKTTNKTQKITQSSLKNLVRETLVESLDSLIDERISQRITESNGLDESIKLVVGNTIFEGKILTTKKIR